MAVARLRASRSITSRRSVIATEHTPTPYFSPESLQDALDRLEWCGSQNDLNNCASLLRSFGFEKSLSHGKRVHNLIVKCGLDHSLYLGSLLVQMYSKCGGLEDAFVLFCDLNERNVFASNIIIREFAQQGQTKVALQIFHQVQEEGIMPDRVSFICILSACAHPTSQMEGKLIHACISGSCFKWDVVICTALVNMYGRSGNLKDAVKTFQESPERDVISWNVMMTSYAQHGQGMETLQGFNQMQQEGALPDKVTFVSMFQSCAAHRKLSEGAQVFARILGSAFERDTSVCNAVIHMYGSCGRLEDAFGMLCIMDERNVVSWNTMIVVYIQNGKEEKALHLLNQMQMEGVIADRVTFINLLGACTNQIALFKGRIIHVHILNIEIKCDTVARTALVNMYGKCGSLDDAQNVFYEVCELDLVLWTAMVAVFSRHDQGMEALRLFDQMQQEGVVPGRDCLECDDRCVHPAWAGKESSSYLPSNATERNCTQQINLLKQS